jgi:glycerol-3-phosphate O-acyltransferase
MCGRLYILDARHGVERRLLLDWLRRSDAACDGMGEPNLMCVPISSRVGARQLRLLADRLSGDDATELVPLRVAWLIPRFTRARGLRLRDLVSGDGRLPGRLRARMILLRDRDRAICLRGAPATLGELRRRFATGGVVPEPEPDLAFASFVVRQAALALDSQERGVQGSRYKVPRFVAESVLAQPGFEADVARLARDRDRSRSDVMNEARKFLREMVSQPSAFFLDLRHQLDRHLWMRGYDPEIRYDPAEFDRLRDTIRAHPTVLLFTHKTYGDAALPGFLLYVTDLPMLHTFGGINLDFPGFGALMRRSGGIFIRRSFRDDPVYKLVLRRYVGYLLEKRFPMSWALEGTRSRVGKLMPPRLGLLKYTLEAAHDARITSLHIVPFVTSFELIRDVDEYVAEQRGRVKKPESLLWLLRYAGGVRRPMGPVRIDLGQPVVVQEAPVPGDDLGLAKIAFETAVQANLVTPLTVTGVMCLLLLGMSPRGATAAELATFVGYLANWARQRGIRLSDELAAGDHAAFFAKLGTLADGGLLMRYDEGRNAIYAIEPSRYPVASYYRNTIVHHFLYKAMLELALAKAADSADEAVEATFWNETERLRELFKFEFFYPPRDRFREELVAELDRSDAEWRTHLGGGRSGVPRLARRLQPYLAHAALLPYVEAYSIVVGLLAQLKPGERLDLKRCVTLALEEGRRAHLLRRISNEASIGRILFENGYRLAANLGLAGDSTGDELEQRQALLDELRSLARRMERLRLEALAYAEQVMARGALQ